MPRIIEDWKLQIVNYAGIIYTLAVIVGIATLNLFYTCPAVFGEGNCGWPSFIAFIIFMEIAVNLSLFQYFNKHNQVSYWRVKSNSLLQDARQSASNDVGDVHHQQYTALNICGPQSDESDYGNRPASSNGINATNTPSILETRGAAMPRNESMQFYHSPTSSPLIPTFEGRYLPHSNVCTTDGNYPPENSLLGFDQRFPFCADCGTTTSRRSHHCPLCKICVLRKDHHCFLTGGCVGLANQRYFIAFLFWASIGTAYGAYFNFSYLNKFAVTEWFPFNWIFYIGPIGLVRWAFGMETLFNTILIVMLTISVASFLGAFGFLCAQMFYTLNGYTMHDYHVGRFKDQLEIDGDTFGERLALVFGRRWWLNFLFPQFWRSNEMTPAMARNIFVSVSKDL